MNRAIKSLKLNINNQLKEAMQLLQDSNNLSSSKNGNVEPWRVDAIDSLRVGKDSPKKQENAPAARVPPVTISDARGRYKVGTVISNKFDGILYKGIVIKVYNGRHYLIEYKDGDEEHMTHTEVRNHLPRIEYIGGYAAALESILTMNAS